MRRVKLFLIGEKVTIKSTGKEKILKLLLKEDLQETKEFRKIEKKYLL